MKYTAEDIRFVGRALSLPFAMACALGALFGCDDSGTREIGPPSPLVRFEPPDLTSSTGESQLEVTLYRAAPEISQGDALELATTVVLLAGGIEVPITAGVKPGVIDPLDTSAKQVIVVTPRESLADVWHELRIPASSNYRPDVGSTTQAGDLIIARFHPSSAPVIQALDVCTKENGSLFAELSFSEEVVFVYDSNQPSPLAVDGIDCDPEPANDFEGDQEIPSSTGTTVHFKCGSGSLRSSTFTIDLQDLESSTGMPVRFYASTLGSVVVSESTATQLSTGCMRWRP